MVEIVSGWADEDRVYLVERSGEDVRVRAVKARWSAFFTDFDDEDRAALQRLKDVVGLWHEPSRSPGLPDYTRIDFKNRWARKDFCWRLGRKYQDQASFRTPGKILEADVNPLRRLLCDHPGVTISASPRLVWLDLETDSRGPIAEVLAGKRRVLSWSIVDQRGALQQGCLEADADDAERDLLSDLLAALRPYDCVLAWYGDGFDFPVLQARSEKLKVMPGGRLPCWSRWTFLDQLEVHKKYNMHSSDSGEEKSSLKLDAVAQHFLGRGKVPFDASRTWEWWEAGGEKRAELLRYNGVDAELMPAIEAKTQYVALHLAVCSVTRCLPDTISLQATQQGDGFLMALGAARGFRWPTKEFREQEEAFAGAFVMAPTRLGLLDDVHVCDFASLYPSIMRSWNMSPETLVWPKEPLPDGVVRARLPYDRSQACFRMDRRGLLPLALDQLVGLRAEYTRKADEAEAGSEEQGHYNRLSQAFKIVVNSMYGIVGSPYSRFHSTPVAEGVTQTGAWLIRHVASRAKAAGLEPVYGDTDSAFVMGDRDRFAELVDELNVDWPQILAEHGCAESHVKLEFEKSFYRVVMVSKKRYAADFSVRKGKPMPRGKKIEVKGLEYKRGDALRLAREMQRELIGMLLREVPPDLEETWEWVRAWRDRVGSGDLGVDDIVMSQSIKGLDEYADRYTTKTCSNRVGKGKAARSCGYDFGGNGVGEDEPEACPKCKAARKLSSQPAHVRVAKLLKERGQDVRSGSRIEYLVVLREGDDADADDDKLLALPARDEGVLERIDRGYYWKKKIYPPSARILEVVHPGVTWVETARQQSARLKAEAIVAGKGRVDDLPLFGVDAEASPK